MDLFLVRHGEAAASWKESMDPGLSDRGRQQALAAARELEAAHPGISAALSSPLRRARETAEPFCSARKLPLVIDERIREIPSPVPLPERQDWLRAFMRQSWDEQPEPILAWRVGILEALLEVRTPSVLFTHFLVINTVIAEVHGRSETLHFWPDNGSVTHLRLERGALALVALGRSMDTAVT